MFAGFASGIFRNGCQCTPLISGDIQIGSIVTAKMIVTDPGYLSEPWELNRDRFYSEGYEFIENDCLPPLRKRTVEKD